MLAGKMILLLSSLLFLEVCLSSAHSSINSSAISGSAESSKNLSSYDTPSSHPTVPNSDRSNIFGKKGNYISTVTFIDLPSFSDFTDINYVDDSNEKFNIHYSNIKFYNLSSAYALSYRIDLDASVVQLLLRLSKGQIKGHYSACEPLGVNKTEEFEVNLYAHLIYSHDISFKVEDGKVIFGKSDNHRLLFDEVKNKYVNPTSTLADELKNYVSPELLEAVTVKISEEIHQKVSLDDVALQIKSEIAFRYRNKVAERLNKAIDDAFEDVHQNAFNVFHHDMSEFKSIVQNSVLREDKYDVTIPTFVLRDVQGFDLHEMKISFAGNNVHGKYRFLMASPLAVFSIVYRDRSYRHAENKTVNGEYNIQHAIYEIDMVANLDTATVELADVDDEFLAKFSSHEFNE